MLRNKFLSDAMSLKSLNFLLESQVLTKCDNEIDAILSNQLHTVAQSWFDNPKRPRPESDVIRAWGQLISEWIDAEDLPLLVRRGHGASEKGSVTAHQSGRPLVTCDNSPAHWVFCLAVNGRTLSLAEVRSLLESDHVPMSIFCTPEQKKSSTYKCSLQKCPESNVSQSGWKLAHIEAVGLHKRGPVERISLEHLFEHFRLLMSPSNMFVVPRSSAGFSEISSVLQTFRQGRASQQ